MEEKQFSKSYLATIIKKIEVVEKKKDYNKSHLLKNLSDLKNDERFEDCDISQGNVRLKRQETHKLFCSCKHSFNVKLEHPFVKIWEKELL